MTRATKLTRGCSASRHRDVKKYPSKRCHCESLEPRYVLDSTVVFNELMYHPVDGEPEWIELHNQMGVDMDISGWRLDGGVEFSFPEGTVVPGRGFLLIASDPAALDGTPAMGPFLGRLADGGEEILLRSNNDRVLDEMDYDDNDPWPIGPDGSGASLAKRNPNTASHVAQNWAVSAEMEGTPGKVNFPIGTQQATQHDLIAVDDVWAFDDSDTPLPSSWKDPGYNTDGWDTGTGVLYAGDIDVPPSALGPESLVGYWNFDGSTVDSSRYANNGILLGGSYSSDVPEAIGAGRALELQAGETGVRIPASSTLNSNVFTLAYWIHDPGQVTGTGSTGGETGHNRVTSRSGDTFETAVNNRTGAGGSSRAKFYGPAIGWTNTPYMVQNGTWTHLAYVYDGTTIRAYADGIEVHSQAASLSPSGDFFIGARHNGVESFVGKIDDVALWDIALSTTTLRALATGLASPILVGAADDFSPTGAGENLYAYWPLNETAGTTAENVAGGTNGTLVGGPTWTADPDRGQVLSFDGSNDYVAAGTIPALAVEDDFTWSFWFKQTTVTNVNAVVLGNRAGGVQSPLQFAKFTPTNFEYYYGAADPFLPFTMPTGVWQHLSVVKSGEELTYYVDGEVVGSAITLNDRAANPFYMGGDPGAAGEYSQGLIDDVALWQTALPAESIVGLAEGDYTPATAPTRFDLGPGGLVFEDRFATATLDAQDWESVDRGISNSGPAGYDPPSTAANAGQLTLGGTSNREPWYGTSVRTLQRFNTSDAITVKVDRVSLTGSNGNYASSIWLWGDEDHYLHVGQNIGTGPDGWQYNVNDVGGTGTLDPTGVGPDLWGLDDLDGDGGLANVRIVFTPVSGGSGTLDVYVNNREPTTHTVSNWPSEIQVMLGAQTRDSGATVEAVFDDLQVFSSGAAGNQESVFGTQMDAGTPADPTDTFYFRREFAFDNAPSRTELTLTPWVDDGAVYYLNGVEIYRHNMPDGVVSHNTLALSENPDETAGDLMTIPGSELVNGTNVLAVELHQAAGSSDAYFGTELSAVVAPAQAHDRVELRLSEITAAGEGEFWVEIHNPSDQMSNARGYELHSNRGDVYVLPVETVLPGGHIIVTAAEMGFTPRDGDRLFLVSPGGFGVVDAVVVDDRPQARSTDHGDRWLFPDVATPGTANSFDLNNDVVINELMYNAPLIRGNEAVFETVELMPIDATWRYSFSDAELEVGWQNTTYAVDDIEWFAGPGPIGFYFTAPNSPIPLGSSHQFSSLFELLGITTFYFQTEFTYNGLPEGFELGIQDLIDDGAVIYVNGQEVTRIRMPEGTVTASTEPSETIGVPEFRDPMIISDEHFVMGQNTLSVEVHKSGLNSMLGLRLVGVRLAEPERPTRENDEQWVELYNRGSEAVDLTGWQFDEGIFYDFEPGTMLGPGEYLVLAENADSFSAQYPDVPLTGQFRGNLARAGELVALTDAFGNPADEVDYRDGGRWDELADGGGSSLELRDPAADNAVPESWSASDETDQGVWQTIVYRGRGTNTSPDPTIYNELILGLHDDGEVLIDDIQVIEDPDGAAIQLIQNGTFDNDALGGTADKWRIIGNHGESHIVTDPDDPTNQVLKLIATGSTEHMHNHAETTLKDGADFVTISSNSTYEISFRARWLAGSDLLNSRLYFNRLARTTFLPIPTQYGTPGERNSSWEANMGPTYAGLRHSPLLPAPEQNVTVTVSAQDPQGVSAMTLHYAIDGGPMMSAAMASQGNGDYTAIIPGQAAATVVQFFVEGEDGTGGTSYFPADGPDSRALFKVDDGLASDIGVHNFRLVMTTEDANWLHQNENVQSNGRIGATVVYGDSDVYYDVGVRLKGSQRGRNKDIRVGFNVKFDPLDLFRGYRPTVSIDRSGSGDQYSQKEILVKQTMNHAGGVTDLHNDIIHFLAPRDVHTGSALLQLARYSDEFLDSQFVNGSDGDLFKYELVYYPTTTTGGPEGLKRPQPDSVVGIRMRDRGEDQEAYRWYFLIRNRRAHDDYDSLMNVLSVMTKSGDTFLEEVDEVLDVDQWLRAFAVQILWGVSDSYVNDSNPHNAVFYIRPSDGRMLYFPWDVDFTASAGATSSLTPNSDLRKMLDSPEYRHSYYGHVHDIITTSYNNDYMDAWIDHYDGFLPSESFASFKNYIATRSNFALNTVNNQIPPVDFEITTNGGADLEVDATEVTLAGNAWVNVREIRLANTLQPLAVEWTDDSVWQTTLPLNAGGNAFVLEAYDFQDNLVASDTISVTSLTANPVAAGLRISEINYNPSDPTAAELEVSADLDNNAFEFLELVNVSDQVINPVGAAFTDGVDFTFPSLDISPGQRVLVVQDEVAFRLRYGDEPTIVGEFESGRLSNAGERIALQDGQGTVILDFAYGDAAPWPESPDGVGATLEIADVHTPAAEFGNSLNWRFSSEFGGSPGVEGAGPVGIVVNEILSSSTPPDTPSDSIELHNVTDALIDLSGWWLSDTDGDLEKYVLPAGTTLEPGEYIVFDENDFNPTPLTPGPNDFALNGSTGDDVWLIVSDGSGGIAQFVDEAHFDSVPPGETLGRSSTGRFAPMGRPTLGCQNADVHVGPLVISEVQYNTMPTLGAMEIDPTLTANEVEFLEIHNPTGEAIDLTDWQIRGGVDYDFDAGLTIAAGETIVVLSFDPDVVGNDAKQQAFRDNYSLDDDVRLVGGYQGTLSDNGERLALLQPGVPPVDDPSVTPRYFSDLFHYDDAAPWPAISGLENTSLTRLAPNSYGDLSGSWSAEFASPGSVGFAGDLVEDANGDGIVDVRDINAVLGAIRQGPAATVYDFDGSGRVDLDDVVMLVESTLGTFMGDANLDSRVNSADLNRVGIGWQQFVCGGWSDGDFNGDNRVSAADLNFVGLNWQRVAAPANAATRTPRAPLARGVALPATVELEVEKLRALDASYETAYAHVEVQDTSEVDTLDRRRAETLSRRDRMSGVARSTHDRLPAVRSSDALLANRPSD